MNVCLLQGKRYNEMTCKIFKTENNICINLFRLKMCICFKPVTYCTEIKFKYEQSQCHFSNMTSALTETLAS